MKPLTKLWARAEAAAPASKKVLKTSEDNFFISRIIKGVTGKYKPLPKHEKSQVLAGLRGSIYG